jgi:hypothetical protein
MFLVSLPVSKSQSTITVDKHIYSKSPASATGRSHTGAALVADRERPTEKGQLKKPINTNQPAPNTHGPIPSPPSRLALPGQSVLFMMAGLSLLGWAGLGCLDVYAYVGGACQQHATHQQCNTESSFIPTALEDLEDLVTLVVTIAAQ